MNDEKMDVSQMPVISASKVMIAEIQARMELKDARIQELELEVKDWLSKHQQVIARAEQAERERDESQELVAKLSDPGVQKDIKSGRFIREAREKLANVWAVLFVQTEIAKQFGAPALGILAIQPNGAGQILMQLSAVPFVADLATLLHDDIKALKKKTQGQSSSLILGPSGAPMKKHT